MFRLVTLALLLLLLAFARRAEARSDYEQRCADVEAAGGTCICSEKFDTNSYATASEQLNPADSITKQCGISLAGYPWLRAGGSPSGAATNLQIVSAATEGLPAGHTVTWVWRNTETHTTSSNHIEGKVGLDDSLKRVCWRTYIKHSSDFEGEFDGACTANKYGNFSWGNGSGNSGGVFAITDGRGGGRLSVFVGNWPADGCTPQVVSPGDNPGNYCDSGWVNEAGVSPRVSLADCRGQWCRMEMCADSPSGVDTAGSAQTVEAWLRVVTGPDAGKEEHWPRVTATPTAEGLIMMKVPGMYRQDTCNGWREFSHTMVAGWTTIGGQTIGAASEIEGGSVVCGDGSIDAPEECDDGDTSSGDGCSASCAEESGWNCTGEPSVCQMIPTVMPWAM